MAVIQVATIYVEWDILVLFVRVVITTECFGTNLINIRWKNSYVWIV